jgi:hypothetical protein
MIGGKIRILIRVTDVKRSGQPLKRNYVMRAFDTYEDDHTVIGLHSKLIGKFSPGFVRALSPLRTPPKWPC